MFAEFRPTHVMHHAAESYVDCSMDEPGEFIHVKNNISLLTEEIICEHFNPWRQRLIKDHQVTIGDLVKSEFYPEFWKHCDVCVDDDLRGIMRG